MDDCGYIGWTEDRTKELEKLWGKGLSASFIADRLGDVSRNAVIGKVHRLGLARRDTKVRVTSFYDNTPARKEALQKANAAKAAKARLKAGATATPCKIPLLRPVKPAHRVAEALTNLPRQPLPLEVISTNSKMLSIDELTATSCRWIDGDARGKHGYCGQHQVKGSSYCPEHHARSVATVALVKTLKGYHRSPPSGISALEAVAEWTAPVEHRIREPA